MKPLLTELLTFGVALQMVKINCWLVNFVSILEKIIIESSFFSIWLISLIFLFAIWPKNDVQLGVWSYHFNLSSCKRNIVSFKLCQGVNLVLKGVSNQIWAVACKKQGLTLQAPNPGGQTLDLVCFYRCCKINYNW